MLAADRYSLQQLCQVNSLTAEICRDESFWRKKLYRDFQYEHRFVSKTWKETWILIPNTTEVVVKMVHVDPENPDNDSDTEPLIPINEDHVNTIRTVIMDNVGIIDIGKLQYRIVDYNIVIGEITRIQVCPFNEYNFTVALGRLGEYRETANDLFGAFYDEPGRHLEHYEDQEGRDRYIIPYFDKPDVSVVIDCNCSEGNSEYYNPFDEVEEVEEMYFGNW